MKLGVSPVPATPTGFSARGFEALVSCTGTLGCTVCLAPQLFLLAYPQTNVGNPVRQLPSCHPSSLTLLPVSTPPTGLDECFFFNSLVVRLPFSLIFWQFWLFFVFKLVVILLLFVRGREIFLPTPLSCLSFRWVALNKIEWTLIRKEY